MMKLCLQRALPSSVLLRAKVASEFGKPPFLASHSQRCFLGTHKRKDKLEPFNSPEGARDFIYSLQPQERTCLLKELQSFESIAIAQEKLEPSPPSPAALKYLLLHSAIPFIGFGFLDNAIMIAAGTQIELSLGVMFGISTMAAAAMGNLVSDLAGLGLAGYVEALAVRLGMKVPELTPKQADMWQTRVSSHLGKAIGVTIGCILGMFPLLFLEDEKETKEIKEIQAPSSAE
ncbi:transmembrane protein 65 [Clupea harengus]|uniref:Transmembrane protein 65 n=1 Tax=Clupea harengus TaxID=7950 RepID=A0A6P3W9T6_CLUHA|nr:transmembrane protein 65 [Clupea harengus]XP_042566554.1 transmembrane protein 65 [Clupea harengus]